MLFRSELTVGTSHLLLSPEACIACGLETSDRPQITVIAELPATEVGRSAEVAQAIRSALFSRHGLPAHTVGFKLSGKLHDADYKTFTQLVDAEIAKDGKVNVLAQLHDLHGWDAHALWDDIKFSTTHCTKVDRIALVGEKAWEQWMAKVCKPFTMATIRYFDAAQLEDAWKWQEEA